MNIIIARETADVKLIYPQKIQAKLFCHSHSKLDKRLAQLFFKRGLFEVCKVEVLVHLPMDGRH